MRRAKSTKPTNSQKEEERENNKEEKKCQIPTSKLLSSFRRYATDNQSSNASDSLLSSTSSIKSRKNSSAPTQSTNKVPLKSKFSSSKYLQPQVRDQNLNLKKQWESAECEIRQLRLDREQSNREIRDEMTRELQRKLVLARQKMQKEKEDALQSNTMHLRSSFEEKLEGIRKIKDKEIRSLENQLKKAQDRLLLSVARQSSEHEKRKSDVGGANNCSNSESHANLTTLMKRSNTTGEIEDKMSELNRQITLLNEKLVSSVAKEKLAEEKCQNLLKELCGANQKYKHRFSSMLEELKSKDRHIGDLQLTLSKLAREECLAQTKCSDSVDTVTVVSIDSGIHSITQPAHHLEISQEEEGNGGKMNFFQSNRHKSHGPIQTISKDDHEKEKVRWGMRVSELETSLRKAEESNASYLQIKAELKRKVVELEKNQKPLLEANKRLSDKNRHFLQESKKMEDKVRHAQEDFLILKDDYDRLVLEYTKVKEKRITPEKLDELERFKQQNLEYCKCITALKQAAIEKDRKIDLLNQKFRRIKKGRGVGGSEVEDDAYSHVSSECSVSSISLDTITEDVEEIERGEGESAFEQLSKEHLKAQRASIKSKKRIKEEPDLETNPLLEVKTDSDMDRSFLSNVERGGWEEEKLFLTSRLISLERKVEDLERGKEELGVELDDYKEQNELLEFKVLELEQNELDMQSQLEVSSSEGAVQKSSCATGVQCNTLSVCDRSVSTSDEEGCFSMDQSDNSSDDGIQRELSPEELKIRFTLLKHRRGLREEDKAVIRQVKTWLEDLQNHHSQCQRKEVEWELRLRETESSLFSEIERLQQQIPIPPTLKQTAIQTDKMEEEETKIYKEKSERLESECLKLGGLLKSSEANEKKLKEMEEKLRKQLNEIGDSRKAEIEFMERNSRQHAESLAKLRDELDHAEKARAAAEREIARLRGTEGSVPAQMEIEKNKLLKETISTMKTAQESLEQKYKENEKKLKESKELIKEYSEIIQDYENTDKQLREKLEELNSNPNNLNDELNNLRKELDKTRAYNTNLENQFQMQLQMVQILKEQIIEKQKESQSSEGLLNFFSELRLRGNEDAEFFEKKVEEVLDLTQDQAQTAENEHLRDGIVDLLTHCGFIRRELVQAKEENENAWTAAKEARNKLESLSRQHHDAVCQLGQMQKLTPRNPEEIKEEGVYIENILKVQPSQFSPLEFSGTESDMLHVRGERSPGNSSSQIEERSSSSASDPVPHSPTLNTHTHTHTHSHPHRIPHSSHSSGADGESSLTDSEGEHWKVKPPQRKPRGVHWPNCL